uniref:Uncharacterized protein n=1 Tax=Anguilla anguilla TaxID=7936 RepID=A0A0E9WKE5_ANGAN
MLLDCFVNVMTLPLHCSNIVRRFCVGWIPEQYTVHVALCAVHAGKMSF